MRELQKGILRPFSFKGIGVASWRFCCRYSRNKKTFERFVCVKRAVVNELRIKLGFSMFLANVQKSDTLANFQRFETYARETWICPWRRTHPKGNTGCTYERNQVNLQSPQIKLAVFKAKRMRVAGFMRIGTVKLQAVLCIWQPVCACLKSQSVKTSILKLPNQPVFST